MTISLIVGKIIWGLGIDAFGMVWLGVGVGVGVVVLDVIFFEVFVGVPGVIGVVGVVELLFPSEPRLG